MRKLSKNFKSKKMVKELANLRKENKRKWREIEEEI
jgi:hypothetical protein